MKRYIFIIAALTALIFSGCSNDDDRPVKTPIDPLTDIYGVVTDNQGNRLQGIVVSDGYTCTATDENGVYQLTAGEFSYHVYLSIPAAYEVPVSEGLPCFWQKLTEGRKRYDFTLTPLAGGAENEFNLFCVADPQCQNTTNIARFNNETVPDIAAQVAASALPSYGITLGDIGWNTENTDYTNDVFPLMKKAMQTDKVGLPLFQVMGNHDNKVIAVSKDNYTVAHDIAAQRNFEYIFGPVNYSFDRGNVHIIAMDNIIFPSHKDYSLGFRDDQVEWLRQDLSYVSKDKMVILCVHIPMRASGNQNVQAVFELLKPFAEVHVMSGHTHYAENNVYDSHYEHVHGAPAAHGGTPRSTSTARPTDTPSTTSRAPRLPTGYTRARGSMPSSRYGSTPPTTSSCVITRKLPVLLQGRRPDRSQCLERRQGLENRSIREWHKNRGNDAFRLHRQ